jgi:hypothetical protein
MCLAPALARACEDEAAKSAEATAKATTCVVKVKVKMVCKEKAVTAISTQSTDCVTPANAPGRNSGWEPGHLIEPDSMRLGPGDDLNAPEPEQWVIISSRTGAIHIHRHPWSSKKTEGRTLQQYGPYRS